MEPHALSIEKAIEELAKSFRAFEKIKPTEYQIVFCLKYGILHIRIRFPVDFPQNAPKILVASRVSHPQVDLFGIIEYPEYYNWDPTINLNEILIRIYSEFNSNPPVPLANPVYPNFSEFIKQYKKTVENEEDIINIVHMTEEFKKLNLDKDKILEFNMDLIRENIRLKKEYNEYYDNVSNKISEYKNLKAQLRETAKNTEEVKSKFSVDNIVKAVSHEERAVNTNTKKILQSFMDKEIKIEEFIDRYYKSVKREKVFQLIKQSQ